MIIKKWENLLRRIPGVQRYYFNWLNRQLGLDLDFRLNQDAALIFEHIFLEREYAPWFPFYENSTIIDIGAHYGYFALFAAINCAPESRIYSFEPSPQNFKTFLQNIPSDRFPQIKVRQLAIAGSSGEAPLYGGHSFNHSLISSEKNKSVIATTPTLSLSDLLNELHLVQVDFLKIDCEGAEYDILLNTSAEVLRKCKVISLEFHDLREQGYTPQQLVQHLETSGFSIALYAFSADYGGKNKNFGRLVGSRS